MRRRNAARRSSRAGLFSGGSTFRTADSSFAPRTPPREIVAIDERLLRITRSKHLTFASELVRLTKGGEDFSDSLLGAMRLAFPRQSAIGDAAMRERGKRLWNSEPIFSAVREILDDAQSSGPRELSAIEKMMADPLRLPKCFACGAVTRWRRRDIPGALSFVGCSRFPQCRHTTSLADLARMLDEKGTSRRIDRKRAGSLRRKSGDHDVGGPG